MQNDIIIHKIDETFIKIECDDSVTGDLVDYFSYSDTIWVGDKKRGKKRYPKSVRVKLFSVRAKTLYRGLLPYVEEFARDNNLTISYSDPSLEYASDISYFEIEKYAKSLNIHTKGKSIEVHDHQLNSVTQAIRNKRSLLIVPTGGGKTLITYIIVRILAPLLQKKNQKILIIVPTINLVEQSYKDFIDYSSVNKWNTEKNVHRIHYGYEKFTDCPITVSTWQSLAEMPMEYFKDFGVIIGDEAHLTTAKSLKYIITSCVNAKYRIGMTGTLDESPIHKLVIEGLFGVVYKPTTTRELMDKGILSQLKINSILLKHTMGTEVKMSSDDEMEFLISNSKRNKFICNLAMSLKNNTLILFRFVERHGVVLHRMLQQLNDGSKKIYFVHGKIDADIREQIRQIMETEDNAIVVASYGTFSTGVSINNLHNLIFASPSAGIVRILQSIGRGLRLNTNKHIANLFDVGDDIRYNLNSENNNTLNHYLKRLSIYKNEKFSYQIYKIRI